MIAAIGAVSRNGVIGLDDWLPWDIPEELAYFEQTIEGAALVIGRRTYESMDVVPEGSVVFTASPGYSVRPGCRKSADIVQALQLARAHCERVFVVGGASTYAAAWPYLDRFFLTHIERDFSGDTSFPRDVPVLSWPLEDERQACFTEMKTGEPVLCRFCIYRQPNPRALRHEP